MTADRLLRFYPPAWRERYGAEFLDLIGPGALGAQQVIDIAMGAVDAWLSAEVRQSAVGGPVVSNSGGRTMLATLKATCGSNKVRYTTVDMLISAAVLIAGTVLMSWGGIALNRSGHHMIGEVLKGLAFPVSMTISMPFGLMKGQPWRAQAVILGGTLFFLIVIGFVSAKI